MTALIILGVAVIVCYIVDISGFTDTWKGWIAKMLDVPAIKDIKPFTCSLCMTWWLGLLALAVSGRFTLGGIVILAVVSMCADIITESLNLFKQAIRTAIDAAWQLLDKLN